jgi:hypothetical protein
MSSLFCPKCLADVCPCVANKVSELEKQNEELKQKLVVAKRALDFYLEEVNVTIEIKDNGQFYIEECNDISSDCSYGATARKALKEIGG